MVARQAHNLKVGGSIPPSATKERGVCSSFFVSLIHFYWGRYNTKELKEKIKILFSYYPYQSSLYIQKVASVKVTFCV